MPRKIGPAAKRKAMERVVEGLSVGTSLAELCREKGMPTRATIYEWRDGDDDFARRIVRARDDGYDAIARRCRETARKRGDTTGDVARDKLIIETDLKLLAKWDPQRYGDKIDITSGNEAFRAPPAAHFWAVRLPKKDEAE